MAWTAPATWLPNVLMASMAVPRPSASVLPTSCSVLSCRASTQNPDTVEDNRYLADIVIAHGPSRAERF